MRPEAETLLWHAHQAADAIAAMAGGKSFADFDADIMLRSAIERQFEIIGEALGRLAQTDPDTAACIPDLPQIVAFRNILIHGYAVIDRARVWRAVEDDLPGLRAVLAQLLDESRDRKR